MVEYQREEGGRWIRHKNRQGKEVSHSQQTLLICSQLDVRMWLVKVELSSLIYFQIWHILGNM